MPTIREMLEKQAALTTTVDKRTSGAPAQGDLTKEASEQLLVDAGLGPLKIAQVAGQLRACAEMEFTYKEAADYLGLPITVIQAVEKVALGS